MRDLRLGLAALLGLATAPIVAPPASAQTAPGKVDSELERYRGMLGSRDPFANPGYLNVDRGAELWAKPAGPKATALSAGCDLGKGVGKPDGAYAELPRFFADAGRVLDLESRLLWCMVNVQGRDAAGIVKGKFSTPEKTSELEDLTAFVASKSNGRPLAAPLQHPRERVAYAVGEAIFYRRQGPWDFACATCHGDKGRRIRLQALPSFDDPKEAQDVMRTWPAYRVSQNALRTMQHRLYDCFWQMRLPQVEYGSDITIALSAYLAAKGRGGIIEAPSIKR